MVSPWPPSTNAVTFSTDTSSSMRDEGAEAGRIQNAGHADHAIAREAAQLVSRLRHGVQRIGNDDEDAVGRILHDLAHHIAHDLVVGVEQIVAAHARLARNAGGDHHDVRVCGIGIIVGAENEASRAFRWASPQAGREPLPCGTPSMMSISTTSASSLAGNPVRGGGAYVSRTNNGDFLTHDVLLRFTALSRRMKSEIRNATYPRPSNPHRE